MKHTVLARFACAFLILVTIANTGCAVQQQRVSQFGKFAQAGIAFADAIPPVLDESFQAAVAADTLILKEVRGEFTDTEWNELTVDQRDEEETLRLESLEAHTELMNDRIELLNDISRHVRLLRRYFVTLSALAQTNAQQSGLVDVADGLVTSLGNVSQRFADATIGEVKVANLVSPVVTLAFASFQSAALNSELERNGNRIERELDLLEAVLAALADGMRSDLDVQFTVENRDLIDLPYIRHGNLPVQWNQRRQDAFQRRISLSAAGQARKAAGSLRSSYVALVENRFGDAQIAALLQDINDLISTVEHIQGAK